MSSKKTIFLLDVPTGYIANRQPIAISPDLERQAVFQNFLRKATTLQRPHSPCNPSHDSRGLYQIRMRLRAF